MLKPTLLWKTEMAATLSFIAVNMVTERGHVHETELSTLKTNLFMECECRVLIYPVIYID